MSTNPSRVQVVPLQQATSREAWRAVDAETIDGKILHQLWRTGGLTDAEIEDATGLSHQSVSGCRRHLVERGLIYASEQRRRTPTGRMAIVWMLGVGPVVPPFVPPNDPEAQGRLFAVGPASAKKQPGGDVWDL